MCTGQQIFAHEDLRYKSFVLKVRQIVSEAMKVKRLERCELYIASPKRRAASRVRFFSDEICVYAKINRQNDRWPCKDPDAVPVIGKTRFSTGIRVPR